MASSATRLLKALPAGDALHEWMRLSVDYIATKKVIASALGLHGRRRDRGFRSSGAQIRSAMLLLVDRAAADDIRPNVDPNDVLRALVGFTYAMPTPGGGPASCASSTS